MDDQSFSADHQVTYSCAFSGKTILRIEAVSKNQVKYLALTSNRKVEQDRDLFNIHPNTGVITTGGKAIDHEVLSIFRMQFSAKDVVTGLISTCLVQINVTDVNDNSPIFGAERYEGRALENSPPNTAVLRIQAHDVDSGPGGEVTYSIDPPSELFTIDRDTGVIRTTRRFDREAANQKVLSITCMARNKGSRLLERKVSVDIIVVDDNDNGPIFDPTEYSLTVKEDAPMGKVIHVFTAKDSDIGSNAKVYFYISDGNEARAFFLRSGGELVVDDKLDFETTKEYKLKIISTDGRKTTQPPATVTIKVREICIIAIL